uniref:Circumsporozoite protein-like protein n=1 Tax=Oryza sativa subsp. japonica TaxID=39947 RepID=Q8W2Z4_ORYSJ|nr:circumsporozoite protein-like protein [Oryza sativa Japonica Group]
MGRDARRRRAGTAAARARGSPATGRWGMGAPGGSKAARQGAARGRAGGGTRRRADTAAAKEATRQAGSSAGQQQGRRQAGQHQPGNHQGSKASNSAKRQGNNSTIEDLSNNGVYSNHVRDGVCTYGASRRVHAKRWRAYAHTHRGLWSHLSPWLAAVSSGLVSV